MSTAIATTAALRLDDVWHSYDQGPRSVEILCGADLELAPSETVAIVGRSGSGKSTLLHIAAGLTTPRRGGIEVAGRSLNGDSARARAAQRRRGIGFVFQFFHLLGHLSVLDNVALPLILDGEVRMTARLRARDLLGAVELLHVIDQRPAELSGGEMQRVAIARALVADPDLVLADEPTGNLDGSSAEQVMDLLLSEVRSRGAALLLVTHDPAIATQADRILRLDEGRLHPAPEI